MTDTTTPIDPTRPAQGLLAGIRFVEIGAGLAAPVTGMLLADAGAEGVRVVDLSSPPADPVLEAVAGRGRTEVPLDLSTPAGKATLLRLVQRCDVVIDDLPHGRLAGLGIDPDALRAAACPGLVSCSIPAFAAGDLRAHLPGHDAVAAAAGCLFEKPLGAPVYHDLPVASVMAGMFAASGIVAALIARLGTGRGQHVGATLFHSTLFAQVLQVLIKTGMPRGFLPLKMIGTPFMRSWECRDGRYVYLHVTLPTHNARVMDVLEGVGFTSEVRMLREALSAETAADPSQVKSLAEAGRLREIYQAVFLQRTADEWEALLGRELCCIKVRTVAEWLRDSIDAGMSDAGVVDDPVFGPVTVPGPGVTSPGHDVPLAPRRVGTDTVATLLALWESGPSDATAALPAPGATVRHPLEGIRVADLSRIIAGPCAARLLAELGADVVSISSPTGLDWSLSFHLMFNTGKRSVTIDSTDDAGKQRLWAVLTDLRPDAMIQNYRNMDVARAVGVDPAAVRVHFPDIVYTHLNAYGDVGVWKDRPGFEQVVQAVSGIQVSYGRDGKPKLLPTPVIDIGSGLAGGLATLLGLYHRRRTGEGVFATTPPHLGGAAAAGASHRGRPAGPVPGRLAGSRDRRVPRCGARGGRRHRAGPGRLRVRGGPAGGPLGVAAWRGFRGRRRARSSGGPGGRHRSPDAVASHPGVAAVGGPGGPGRQRRRRSGGSCIAAAGRTPAPGSGPASGRFSSSVPGLPRGTDLRPQSPPAVGDAAGRGVASEGTRRGHPRGAGPDRRGRPGGQRGAAVSSEQGAAALAVRRGALGVVRLAVREHLIGSEAGSPSALPTGSKRPDANYRYFSCTKMSTPSRGAFFSWSQYGEMRRRLSMTPGSTSIRRSTSAPVV